MPTLMPIMMSTARTSAEKMFMMRPSGVVSKKDMAARSTLVMSSKWIVLPALVRDSRLRFMLMNVAKEPSTTSREYWPR